ncbi:MAG: hypothetical protein V1656_03535 [Candidatus Jorgensenbacteria bacterium]
MSFNNGKNGRGPAEREGFFVDPKNLEPIDESATGFPDIDDSAGILPIESESEKDVVEKDENDLWTGIHETPPAEPDPESGPKIKVGDAWYSYRTRNMIRVEAVQNSAPRKYVIRHFPAETNVKAEESIGATEVLSEEELWDSLESDEEAIARIAELGLGRLDVPARVDDGIRHQVVSLYEARKEEAKGRIVEGDKWGNEEGVAFSFSESAIPFDVRNCEFYFRGIDKDTNRVILMVSYKMLNESGMLEEKEITTIEISPHDFLRLNADRASYEALGNAIN